MAKFEYGVEMALDGVVGVDWKFKNGVGHGVASGWNLGLVLGWHLGWCLGWLVVGVAGVATWMGWQGLIHDAFLFYSDALCTQTCKWRWDYNQDINRHFNLLHQNYKGILRSMFIM